METFGAGSPSADAEVICLAKSVFDVLGVKDLSLEINSIGCPSCRAEYHKALKEYFRGYQDQLCETCRDRLERNPMRILDCKSPVCSKIAQGAPVMLDYLCEECRTHFQGVKDCLDAMGMSYTVNPTIVRGLDYYTKTVFEFVSEAIGAQGTVCGGGRYDGLVEEIGGPSMPSLGFGMGLERLMLVLSQPGGALEGIAAPTCDLYIAPLGENARAQAFCLTERIRTTSLNAECDLTGRSLKAQMKYADKLGAKFSLVVGDAELEEKKARVKNMATGEQTEISLGDSFADEFTQLYFAAQNSFSL